MFLIFISAYLTMEMIFIDFGFIFKFSHFELGLNLSKQKKHHLEVLRNYFFITLQRFR